MEKAFCGICGADSPTHFLNRRDRFSGDLFEYVFCQNCGHIYLDPRPSPSEIIAYYPEGYESYDVLDDSRPAMEQWHIRQMLERQLNFVEKISGQRGSLLDVGCAAGKFMLAAEERGWRVKGVELVEEVARIAREKYKLNVSTGSFDALDETGNHYDVITMWDVLEHLPSPASALRRANLFLKADGVLVFSIPNLASFDRRIFGPAWIGWDAPRHFYLFSEQDIARLLQETGFSFEDKQCLGGGKGSFFLSLDMVSLKYLSFVRKLQPVVSALLWPYRQISYSLKKGPVITYAARKIS
jgi:SAM-dependent methyltransferase